MNLRTTISQFIKAVRSHRAAQKTKPVSSRKNKLKAKSPTTTPKPALAKPVKTSSGMPKIGPVAGFLELWKLVATGVFNYGRWRERSYLQALHNVETVHYIAGQLAQHSGCRVMVASAFIDGTPRFTWTSPSTQGQVTGELGDILAIFEVHDNHGGVEHFASLLQAKVSDLANDVRTGSATSTSSTRKELDLYQHWPPVAFQYTTQTYSLNPAQKTWPSFAFSRFLTISDPTDKDAAAPAPAWRVNGPNAADSPFAVFEEPATHASPFLTWLTQAVMPWTNKAEPVNIVNPVSDFDRLVVDMLGNLLRRQEADLVGSSGGMLIQHAHARLASFGVQSPAAAWLVQADAVPGLKTSIEIPGVRLGLPPARILATEYADKPMLVLYVVKGPEGVDQRHERPGSRPAATYPGAGLLD